MTDNFQQFLSLIEKHAQDTGSILVSTRREAARFYIRAGRIYSATLDREELPLDRRIHLCVQDDLDGAAIKAESNARRNSSDLLFHLRQQQLLPDSFVKRISRDFFLAISEMAFYEWKNPTMKWKGRDQLAFDQGFQIAPLAVERLGSILEKEAAVLTEFADAINVEPSEVRRINVHSIPDRVYGPERDYDNYVYNLSSYNIPIGKIIDDSGLMGTANIIRAVTITWKSHVISLSLDGNTIEYPWNDEGQESPEDYEAVQEEAPVEDEGEPSPEPEYEEEDGYEDEYVDDVPAEDQPPISLDKLNEENSRDEYDDGHTHEDDYDDGYDQSFTHPAVAAQAVPAPPSANAPTANREEPVSTFTAVPPAPTRPGIPAPPRTPLAPPSSRSTIQESSSASSPSSNVSSMLTNLRQIIEELRSHESALDANLDRYRQEREVIVQELQEKEKLLHEYDDLIKQEEVQRGEIREQLAQLGL